MRYLQSREEGLQRVNPRVHELPAEHVHVDVEGRVPVPLVTGFPAEEPSRTVREKGETRLEPCSSVGPCSFTAVESTSTFAPNTFFKPLETDRLSLSIQYSSMR